MIEPLAHRYARITHAAIGLAGVGVSLGFLLTL